MSFQHTNRRRFLQCAATLIASTSVTRPRSAHTDRQSDARLFELTAVDAVEAMRAGDMSAESYAAALLEQCHRHVDLNIWISLDAQRVIEAAREADKRRAAGLRLGALHGLPIPIKDSVNTIDLPTTGGTRALRNFRPKANAPVVQSLFDAGAILLGKTNLHELSFGVTSNNLVYGPVRNPYDRSRIPGGSSGGTAVAVATRMAPMGVAADTAGSVRIPAALCGVVGFRPSVGRYSSQGVIPITAKFDTLGPQARTVKDLLLFDSVVSNEPGVKPAVALKGARLGVPRTYYWEDLEGGLDQIAHGALERLRDAGAILIEADVPDIAKLIDASVGPIILSEVVASIEAYLKANEVGLTFADLLAQMGDNTRAAFELFAVPNAPKKPPAEIYAAALKTHRPALQAAMREYFRSHELDAMVFPTTPLVARPIGEEPETEHNGKKYRTARIFSRNIYSASCAGLPALSLPIGLTNDGLPIGLEFNAAVQSDRNLLALALELETALGPIPAPKH